MLKKWLIYAHLVFLCSPVLSNVLIITHSYNRPDFIELQHKTFKKFMLDKYEFVVFNDAADTKIHDEINKTCSKLHIQCIPIPQELHTIPYLPRKPNDPLDRPNIRHATSIQYSMNTIGFDHQGPVVILDSDLFLVRSLSITKQLENYDVVAMMAGGDNGKGDSAGYLCPILTIFAMDKLPNKKTLNFNCGTVDKGISVDSGGWTYYYLKDNPQLRLKPLQNFYGYQLFCPDYVVPNLADKKTPLHQQIEKLDQFGFNKNEINFLLKKPDTIHFIIDRDSGICFLHYRAGTNYDAKSKIYGQQKTRLIAEFLDSVLNQK